MRLKEFMLYDNLKRRILGKLDENIVPDTEEEISLFSLDRLLKDGLVEYNYIFVNDIEKITKLLNKKIKKTNRFKAKLPLIYSISPYVRKDGRYYVNICFGDKEDKYIGEANVLEDESIVFETLRNGYYEETVSDFLNEHMNIFSVYLTTLEEFKTDYPETDCSWNTDESKELKKARIGDGFLDASFDLDNPKSPGLSFSNMKDIEVSQYETADHDLLDDYVDFYKSGFLKRMRVNINDLNPLYQAIVRKQMELKKEKELKRVK